MSASPFCYRNVEVHTSENYILGISSKDDDLIIKNLLTNEVFKVNCQDISEAFMFQDRYNLGVRAIITHLMDLGDADKDYFYSTVTPEKETLICYDILIEKYKEFKSLFNLKSYSSRDVINELFPHKK